MKLASLILAFALLSGCMIRFEHVQTIPTERNFAALSCDELAGEKVRIEFGFNTQIKQHDPGTKRTVGTLKGEMEAANAAIAIKDCPIAPVVMPMNKPLHKP